MKTVKIIFCAFMQIIVAQHISAQTLKVLPNFVDINGTERIRHVGTTDCVDIIAAPGSSPLESGADLIWGAFYESQPNNPGIFTLSSVMANGWTPCFTVRANGNVGIFNYSPSTALEIGTVGSTRQVKVNGSIVVGSDMRMKKDIRDIGSSVSKIRKLRSVSYLFNQSEETPPIPEKIANSLSSEEIEKMRKDVEKVRMTRKKVDNRVSYGFLAQELKEVFPDLVYADSAGMLSVDYIGIIPFLVKSIQEQQAQIDEQQVQIEELKSAIPSKGSLRSSSIGEESSDISLVENTISEIVLYQNTPNPFTESTQIKYYLPETVKKASLCIYDMQGKQLKHIILTLRGENIETISGSQLAAGIYLYALIADGREAGIKRMVLTE